MRFELKVNGEVYGYYDTLEAMQNAIKAGMALGNFAFTWRKVNGGYKVYLNGTVNSTWTELATAISACGPLVMAFATGDTGSFTLEIRLEVIDAPNNNPPPMNE